MERRLRKLSETLRAMPRHQWDRYLREFCEDLVAESWKPPSSHARDVLERSSCPAHRRERGDSPSSPGSE